MEASARERAPLIGELLAEGNPCCSLDREADIFTTVIAATAAGKSTVAVEVRMLVLLRWLARR